MKAAVSFCSPETRSLVFLRSLGASSPEPAPESSNLFFSDSYSRRFDSGAPRLWRTSTWRQERLLTPLTLLHLTCGSMNWQLPSEQVHHHPLSSLEYALKILSKHGHLLNLLRCPSFADSRSDRINYLLAERCRKIKSRYSHLDTLFKRVIEGTGEKPLKRSRQDQEILHHWKSYFRNKLETPGSPGWHYLHDRNWKIIEAVLEDLFKNCLKLVRRSR